MKKKVVSAFLSLILILGFPMATALAAGGFHDYQQAVLQYSNEYHNGSELILDARLCAMAAMLAVEQDGKSEMSAYRPDGQKWDTIFEEYGYSAVRASSGCNWMRSKTKPSAKQIVEYWMKTPGVKENVSSSMYSHTGVYMHYSAKAKCYYIVQLFTKPASNQDTSFPSAAQAVATGNVNVRSGPSTGYSKIGKLKKAQIISVVSESGDWAEINLPQNGKGYVHKDYISPVCNSAVTLQIDMPSTDLGSVGAATATANVNVRQGSGTNYKKLGQLRKGQTVAVWNINGKWAEITWTGSQRGYVHTDYLSFNSDNDSAPSLAIKALATATGNGVNVRSGPGTSYKCLGKIKKGEVLPVVDQSGDWLKIEWNSSNAYVHSRYFKW